MDSVELEHVKILRLEEGDELVFATPEALSVEQATTIVERLEERFPGHRATILSKGAELQIVRAGAE